MSESALQDFLKELISGYPNADDFNSMNKGKGIGDVKYLDFTNLIRNAEIVKKVVMDKNNDAFKNYKIYGRVGDGRWTYIPSVAICDRRITESIQRGEYIIYLRSTDNKTLYLTFNQGCYDLDKIFKRKKLIIDELKKRARCIQGLIQDDRGFLRASDNNSISLIEGDNIKSPKSKIKGELYAAGCVFFKKYEVDNLPEEKELRDDLNRMIDIYLEFVSKHNVYEQRCKGETMKLNRNIIFYGPPGTGKTYNTVIYSVAICKGEDIEKLKQDSYSVVLSEYNNLKKDGRIAFTTFHQSYGYEEFIEGIRPVLGENGDGLRYRIEDGAFKKFCKQVELINDSNKEGEKEPCVFIIDEINRANVSKIFGELITLIEDTKRAGLSEAASARLPYSGEEFSVPENVYMIGTMNTADRSIALMDTALRRRFKFIEMMPDTTVLQNIKIDKIDVGSILDTINKRIEILYDREHTIGHAFFTDLEKNPTIERLGEIFEKSVIPLLQEYFYEDYQKIQLVLGDCGKKDPNLKFIIDEEIRVKTLFKGNSEEIDIPEKMYRINRDAFSNPEAYIKII